MTDLEKIEKVVIENVQPQLFGHGGGVETLSYEDGVYRFRLLGSCLGCPSATQHVETLLKTELSKVLPGLKSVEMDSGITEDMWAQAMSILRKSGPKEAPQ